MTLATGAKKSAMPIPARMNGPTRLVYATSGVTAAIQASAAAWRARPATISGCPPTRSERAPAMGATNTGATVHGSTRKPAASGE
jgi:hypothetical protein